ncbi:MAG: MarR family transcriptional regulator [Methylococcales bacterium]
MYNPGIRCYAFLSGGNPRATVILYDLFAAGWPDDLHTDLRVLLDAMSPLYKSRMEILAEQPRKLLAHLMEHWAPMAVKDLAGISGIANTTVSGQLTRLEAEGLVEKTRLKGTSLARWQVAKRLFNVWYLMRYTTRRVRQRLTWLVEFMRLWYSGEELQSLARSRVHRHAQGALSGGEQLEYCLALASALNESHRERHQLEYAVFSNAWRIAQQQHRSLAEAFPELFDLKGMDRPFRSAEDYLRRFNALHEKLARYPHAVGPEQQKSWIDAVKGRLSIILEDKERIAENAENLRTDLYEALAQVFSDEARQFREGWYETYGRVYKATLEGAFFPDCPDVELAYRQILAAVGDDAEAVTFCTVLLANSHPDGWMKRACQLVPEDAKFWLRLGYRMEDHLGRYVDAEAAYRKAIELDPQFAYATADLARLLAQTGQKPAADEAYRKAVQLAGTAAESKTGVAYFELLLQVHIWLENPDSARLALDRMAQAASAGDANAMFRLKEQARECHTIGLGLALSDLIAASPHADFLRPLELALRAAHGDRDSP